MKNLLKNLVFCLILTTIIPTTKAQIHDFDSLYKNDEIFKQEFKSSNVSNYIFSSEEVLKITIESDFKNLVKRKYEDEEQPALFRYYYKDTIVINQNISIQPRGNMRKASCFFPPLKLNFLKSEVVLEEMKEFDKMKMVLDCKRGSMYEQYLLSEYFTYKILNILTEYSFQVRLIQVTYVDTSEKYKTATRYAFLIENKDQMAKRLNALPIDNKNVSDRLTNIPILVNAYLFQYLIGNTDWSIPGRHNLQLIKSKDPSIQAPYVIPYDFDYAGIVNATYAVPHESLGLNSVRERLYRGVCLPESTIKDGIKNFKERKQEIYNLYNHSDLMSKNNKNMTLNYLDEFYNIIEYENILKINIIDSCR